MVQKKKGTKAQSNFIWCLTVALFSSFIIFNLNTAGSLVMAILVFVISLFNAAEHKWKLYIKLEAMHVFFFSLAAYCILSGIWALNSNYAIEKGITIFEISICMSLLYIYYSRFDSVDALMKVVMWGGTIVAIYNIISVGIPALLYAMQTGTRIGGEFANVNNVAMVSSYAIIIAVYYGLYNGFTPVDVVVFIPCLLCIAGSGSKKGIIGLVGGVILLNIAKSKSKSFAFTLLKASLIMAAAWLLVGYLATLPMFSTVAYRMQSLVNLATGTGDVDWSTRMRQVMIEEGFAQFLRTPIQGIGIGCTRILNQSWTGMNAYLHNNFVELLAGGGAVAFLLFYGMYAYVFYYMFKYRKKENSLSSLVLVLLLIFLVMDYGAVSYYLKDTFFYFMIFFVHVNNLKNKNNSTTISS